ncbi:MauE/DoxX family redox-associated membrane protein [Amycolatopsis vastitatis]|nr:MauE/DoxX family redox-associated membrane protein [Amycolatopsis vastitatis]
MESLEPLPGVGVLAARIVLATLFALGGLSKLSGPHGIAVAAVRYRVLKKPHRAFGYALGVAELATTVLLLLPAPFATAGCVVAGLLSVSFVLVSVPALRRGDRFACGCLFGQSQLSWATPFRAVGMVTAATIGLLATPVAPGVEPVMGAVGLATIVLGLPFATNIFQRMQAFSRKEGHA